MASIRKKMPLPREQRIEGNAAGAPASAALCPQRWTRVPKSEAGTVPTAVSCRIMAPNANAAHVRHYNRCRTATLHIELAGGAITPNAAPSDPERSQKHPSDKAARPDRCSSRKLRPRAKIVAPHCSRPIPGFAVLAVFCSEFNSGPKPFVAPWPIARALPQAPDEGGRGKLMEPRSYWLTFTIIKREAITCCVYHINAKYTIMCKWSRGSHDGTRSDLQAALAGAREAAAAA